MLPGYLQTDIFRFAALEQKLLKDQEEKFLAIMAILKEPKTEEPEGLAALRSLVEDRLLPAVEKMETGKVQVQLHTGQIWE